jgi:hypothetical protein
MVIVLLLFGQSKTALCSPEANCAVTVQENRVWGVLFRPLVLLSADAINSRRSAQREGKRGNSDIDGTNNAGEAQGARFRPLEQGVMDVVQHGGVSL